MQKETLTLSNIIKDMRIIADLHKFRESEKYDVYIIPILMIALGVGFFLRLVWLAIAIGTLAIYPAICSIRSFQKARTTKKTIDSIMSRGDISISVKALSHIATETIYEPHSCGRHSHATKTVLFFYFVAGRRWRVPEIFHHYEWSKEFYLTTEGLENISLPDDEFFYVSLQGYPDIAYIYPCKLFALDSTLKVEE